MMRRVAVCWLAIGSHGGATIGELNRSAPAVVRRGIVRWWTLRGQEGPRMLSELHDLSERWFQAWLERMPTGDGAVLLQRQVAGSRASLQ